MVRYLLRSKNIGEERLLYSAFTERQKLSNETNTWIEKAKEIVDNTGHSYMFQMATNRNNRNEIKDIKSLSNKVQKREKEIFEQKLFCHLENKKAKKEGKLVFYANLKQTFGQENYLRLKNIQNRNAIRDIRMSTHKLSIETGRYEKIPRDSRMCPCCKEKNVESEEHFIFECKNYKEERTNFLKMISKENKKMNTRTLQQLFKINDLKSLNELGKFLKACNEKRLITIILKELLDKVAENLYNIINP